MQHSRDIKFCSPCIYNVFQTFKRNWSRTERIRKKKRSIKDLKWDILLCDRWYYQGLIAYCRIHLSLNHNYVKMKARKRRKLALCVFVLNFVDVNYFGVSFVTFSWHVNFKPINILEYVFSELYTWPSRRAS